jgi:hypothetical protein
LLFSTSQLLAGVEILISLAIQRDIDISDNRSPILSPGYLFWKSKYTFWAEYYRTISSSYAASI